MHFNDRAFRIFRNGWFDCSLRDTFNVVLLFITLRNGLKMSEYEAY